MRTTFLAGIMLALLALTGFASASSVDVDIRDVVVSPTEPRVGDTISVQVQLSVTGPSDPKVKLYLYVDGELEETFTDFFDTFGLQYHTFYVETSDMYAGTKSIVVEADVYDGSGIADTSTRRLDIFLKDAYSVSRVHDLTITQISYKNPVLAGEKFPVTVYVKNTGSIEERNVRIFVRLGDELEKSEFFNIKRDETQARTVYIKAPPAGGTYNIILEAENRVTHTIENKIDVVSNSITMNINPQSTAGLEEWITVSGYAFSGAEIPARSVSIYKDGQYVSSASPDRSGYYSSSVRFFATGRHSIAVRLGDLEKYATLNIVKSTAKPEVYTPPVAQAGETVVIVKDGKVQVYYGGSVVASAAAQLPSAQATVTVPLQNATPIAPYVSVTPSAKEVYSNQYKANTFYIDITNHLGRESVFGVKTDINPSLVFMPSQISIKDGETKTLAVMFNPAEGATGTVSGNFVVYEGDNIVKSFPASLFIVGKPEKLAVSGMGFPKIPPLVFDALLGLAIIIVAAYAAARYKKPHPLEPKIMPFTPAAAAKTPSVASMQRKIKSGGIFRVPWENVIV